MRIIVFAFLVVWTLIAAATALMAAGFLLLLPILSITGAMNVGGFGWVLLAMLLSGLILAVASWALLFGMRHLASATRGQADSRAGKHFPTGEVLLFATRRFIPVWASLTFMGLGITGCIVAPLAYMGLISANEPVTAAGLVMALVFCGGIILLGLHPLLEVNKLTLDCRRRLYELHEGWLWSPNRMTGSFTDLNRLRISRELRSASSEDRDDVEYAVYVLHLEFNDGRRFLLTESPTADDVFNRLLSRQPADDHDIVAGIADQLAPRLGVAVLDLSFRPEGAEGAAEGGAEGEAGVFSEAMLHHAAPRPLPHDLRTLLPQPAAHHPLRFEPIDQGVRVVIPPPWIREPLTHVIGAAVAASAIIFPTATALSAAWQYQQYQGLGRWVAVICGLFGVIMVLGGLCFLLTMVPRRLARTVLQVTPASIEYWQRLHKWTVDHASLPLRSIRRIELINNEVLIRCENTNAGGSQQLLDHAAPTTPLLQLPALDSSQAADLAKALRTLVAALRAATPIASAPQGPGLRASAAAVD